MNSIKSKMMGSYLLVTVLTVTFLILFQLIYIRFSYMDNIKKILLERAESYSSFYSEYLNNDSLVNNVGKIQKTLLEEDVQIQIYDKSGIILSDSLSMIPSRESKLSKDVSIGLTGSSQFRVYKHNKEELLALSCPLKRYNSVVGVIRLITSLEPYNHTVWRITFDFIATGIGIIMIVAIISYHLSANITRPIQYLTGAAQEMAAGKYYSNLHIDSKDEIGKLADSLNFMAGEIDKREKLKDEFIASVSHDLRTPLTSIRGWAETITSGDSDLDEESREGLNIIKNESIRLSTMVEDLLDFSKFSIGKIKIDITDIDLELLLLDIQKLVKPRTIRQNITMKTDFPEQPCKIRADEKRLKQILFNLLDNSLKNTPGGGNITVGFRNSIKTVELYVEDTGCGIPEDELKEVTRKFYVGKNQETGSGIGLAIVEEIVRLHDWELSMSSVLGKGTIVTIRIKL